MKSIEKKSKYTLEQVINHILDSKYKSESYNEQAAAINRMVSEGRLVPVQASKTNGKKPALYNSYWLIYKQRDYSDDYSEELSLLNGHIDTSYYSNHMSCYHDDREYVLQLNKFMNNLAENTKIRCSVNERSFEIWQKEKMLEKGGSAEGKGLGLTILNNCGISMDMLNVYQTYEPLAYYRKPGTLEGAVLIVENEDTYFGIRQHLQNGKKTVFNVPISAIIYGAGNRFPSMVKSIHISLDADMLNESVEYLYFGDLDYAGISIYENSLKNTDVTIKPFREAYIAMLDKKDWKYQDKAMPETKSGQKDRQTGIFLSYFNKDERLRIMSLLESRKYIPQEIVNIGDY